MEPSDPQLAEWEEYFLRVRALEAAGEKAEAHGVFQRACQLVSAGRGPERWRWLQDAFAGDAAHAHFAASVFHAQPVPVALFEPMLRAGLRHGDASSIQFFVRPCTETYGADRVLDVLRVLARDDPSLERGLRKAQYWIRDGRTPRRQT